MQDSSEGWVNEASFSSYEDNFVDDKVENTTLPEPSGQMCKEDYVFMAAKRHSNICQMIGEGKNALMCSCSCYFLTYSQSLEILTTLLMLPT
jgi:hypothetical protein